MKPRRPDSPAVVALKAHRTEMRRAIRNILNRQQRMPDQFNRRDEWLDSCLSRLRELEAADSAAILRAQGWQGIAIEGQGA